MWYMPAGQVKVMKIDSNDSTPYSWIILSILFFSQLTMTMGAFGYGPLAPFLREEFSVSLSQIGSLISTFFIAQTVNAIPSGILIDRIGARSMLIACLIIEGISYGAMTIAPNFFVILVCTAISGLGYGVVNQASTKGIMYWFSRRMRGTAMGIKQTGVTIGGGIVAMMTPAISITYGWKLAVMITSGLMLVMAILTALFYRERPPDHQSENQHETSVAKHHSSLQRIIFQPTFLMLLLLLPFLSFGHGSFISFLVLYLKEHLMYPVDKAGFCLAIAMVAASVGRIGWGMLSDLTFRGDRLMPIVLLSLIGGLSSMGMGLLIPHSSLWLAFFWSALIGLTLSGWNPVVMVLLAEFGGVELAASVQSIGLTFTGAGFALGPIIFGYTADHLGYFISWMIVMTFSFVSTLGFFYLWYKKYR